MYVLIEFFGGNKLNKIKLNIYALLTCDNKEVV